MMNMNTGAKVVTARDVANAVGCSVASVRQVCLTDKSKISLSNNLRNKIEKAIKELGYSSTLVHQQFMGKAHEKQFALNHAGFKDKQELDAHMLALRSMGYSNAQIGKKVGLTHASVIYHIGTQPADMTAENQLAAQKHRARENQRRKVFVDTHLVRTYNDMIVECQQLHEQITGLSAKAEQLESKIEEMRPQVAGAKLSTVEPMMIQRTSHVSIDTALQ